ncbi:MAG TPA: hypothetical protein VMH30_07170 [Verrucomicrobiae bacterium]|nr:hypothetical protein [Verrucomicrobiae bacterium]
MSGRSVPGDFNPKFISGANLLKKQQMLFVAAVDFEGRPLFSPFDTMPLPAIRVGGCDKGDFSHCPSFN